MHFYNMTGSFSSFWAQAYGLGSAPAGQRGDTNEDTLKLMETSDVVRGARFSWHGLRVKIPWLERTEGGWKAVWPMLTSRVQEAWPMHLAKLTAAKAGVHIVSQQVLSLNRAYCRKEGPLDLKELFILSDRLENRRHREADTIEALQSDMETDLGLLIKEAQTLFAGPCPEPVSGKHCANGRRCDGYESCFRTDQRKGDDLLFLRGFPGREDLAAGSMAELDPESMGGSPAAAAQVQASRHNPFLDRDRLSAWLEQAQKPYSYLDFEWDTFAIPPYAGMKPFDVLCFQFSLHTETESGLQHTSYFGHGDCRRAFIERLLATVPETGTIFVYNMEGAERLRLKQLAVQFPEYEERLRQIWERMMDLSKPFETGMYYHLDMKGRFSLKQVVKLFTKDPVYHDLAIRNGLQAVEAYRMYDHADAETQNRIERELSRYCGMDTYAEYLVLHGLIRAMEEPENAKSDHTCPAG